MLFALMLGGALFDAGCRLVPHRERPVNGTSSFVVVESPPPKMHLGPPTEPSTEPILEEHFVEAEPIEPLPMPVYPAKTLAGKATLVTVGVRVSIDADGRVTAFTPSLLTFSTPGRNADKFQEAVRQAVMQWRFHPAQHYLLRIFRGEEGGGPPREIHRENTEAAFDLAFTFTAAGKVLPVASTQ